MLSPGGLWAVQDCRGGRLGARVGLLAILELCCGCGCCRSLPSGGTRLQLSVDAVGQQRVHANRALQLPLFAVAKQLPSCAAVVPQALGIGDEFIPQVRYPGVQPFGVPVADVCQEVSTERLALTCR